ncbi:AraC family transcriptional regulator [Oleidesulfovibrio sp.]|uniref:AraC family transcriptional regulator n=1 Tax=Oleidesulfovibrio sp. TaxID=2909707 RepID=UPI003A84AE9B
MEVRVVKMGEFSVAGIRTYGPYDTSAPEAWTMLAPWLDRTAKDSFEVIYWGIMHDDLYMTPAHSIRYEAAVSIPADFRHDDTVFVRTIPSCEYAVAEYTGPYHEVQGIWLRLLWDWLPLSGRCPATQPFMEQYIGSPANTSSALMTTRLYLPLAPL